MKKDKEPGNKTFRNFQYDEPNWKFGIFYFNKNDKRIFPPKRYKPFGFTVNFANPFLILTLFGLISLLIFIPTYNIYYF